MKTRVMSGETFAKWCREMQTAGLAESDREAGKLLGKSTDRMVAYKKEGADITVALACAALLHRMKPYT